MAVSSGIRQQINNHSALINSLCPLMSGRWIARKKKKKLKNGILSTCSTKMENRLKIDGKEYNHSWNKLSPLGHLSNCWAKTCTINPERPRFCALTDLVFLSRYSRGTMVLDNRKLDWKLHGHSWRSPKTHRVMNCCHVVTSWGYQIW